MAPIRVLLLALVIVALPTIGLLADEAPSRGSEEEVEGRGALTYGLSHNLTYVFAAPANKSQRVGIVIVRQFGGRRFGLKVPKIAGQVSYSLDDPIRKGQLTSALGVTMALFR